MRFDRFFLLGIGLLVAVFFMLAAFLNNLRFPEESFSAIFNLTNRFGKFSINDINAACGQNSLPLVSLSWTTPGRASSYLIQRKAGKTSLWTILGATEQTWLLDSNWTNDYQAGLYQYRVIASGQTRSLTSKTASIRVPACTASNSESPASATSSSPNSSAASTPSKAPVLWGAYPGNQPSDAADFESQVGKKMNLQAVFLDFPNDSFPSQFKKSVGDQGKTLIIFWEPHTAGLDDIAGGRYDPYIRQFAAEVKTYGAPVILSPFHEMNGDWSFWSGTVGTNTPAKVIAAWKHIHDLAAPVSNIKFGWAVNCESDPDP